METVSEQRCHGGVQGFYRHTSAETGTPMRFAVYLPPAARRGPVPVLYFLAGLTCTEETATIKAGAQVHASRLGLALVMPDTSPRGTSIEGEDDQFLEVQLHPHLLEEACTAAGQPLELRRHAGYDHSYWFIQTFIADHLEHHARGLAG